MILVRLNFPPEPAALSVDAELEKSAIRIDAITEVDRPSRRRNDLPEGEEPAVSTIELVESQSADRGEEHRTSGVAHYRRHASVGSACNPSVNGRARSDVAHPISAEATRAASRLPSRVAVRSG